MNYDGAFDIADVVYLGAWPEPTNQVPLFAGDGFLPVIGDTLPPWGRPPADAGAVPPVTHRVSVFNLNDVDIVFKCVYGDAAGPHGWWRCPVVPARAGRTLYGLIENAVGIATSADPRWGTVFYDLRLTDGSEPSAAQLARVFVTATLTVDGRGMTVMPVKRAAYETIGGSSVVPLPADVENQAAIAVLPNPGPVPATTRVNLRGPTGQVLGTRDYTTEARGVTRFEPFSALAVTPRPGCYLETVTFYGTYDVFPSLVLTDRNSRSLTHVPVKKVFDGRKDVIIPLVVNKTISMADDPYLLQTDTFVNNFGQTNGVQALYLFNKDGIDNFHVPGSSQSTLLPIGQNEYFSNVLVALILGSDTTGHIFDTTIDGGKLRWGLTRLTGPDGRTALACTPGTTSDDDATGNLEQVITGLRRDATHRSDLRLIQTGYPANGTVTVGAWADNRFLGYRTFTGLPLSGMVIEDIFAQFPDPGGTVKDGALRIVANAGRFQAFAMTWNLTDGSILWTPGQTYDHGENHAFEFLCIFYMNAEVNLCDSDGDSQIDAFLGFSPTGVTKNFRLLGTDQDGDPLNYAISCITGPMPDGVVLNSNGTFSITPMQKYAGQQFRLRLEGSDALANKQLLFAYKLN